MSDMEPEFKRYRVHMKTRPGMYAQYEGPLDVWSNGVDLFMDAVRELRRTAFSDYSANMWQLVSVEGAAHD